MINYSAAILSYYATIEECEKQLLDVAFLIQKHQSHLCSQIPTDRRYHEKELKDGRIRLRSLTMLADETRLKLNIALDESTSSKGAKVAEDVQTDRTHEILANEEQFFNLFFKDLDKAKKSVEIVCPFVSQHRLDVLQKLSSLTKRNLKCVLYTRPPDTEEKKAYLEEARNLGLQVQQRDKWHHKIAIIDDIICWEGSLNIMSHSSSQDTMRKLVGRKYVAGYRRLLNLQMS